MQLFLDSFGAFLGVRNGQFLVRMGTSRTEHSFPIRDVNVIFLTRGTTHTSDALILALNHDIPVIFLDNIGHPIGQVWSGKFGSITTIRRNQIQFSIDTEGWLWLAKHLARKIDTQNGVLHQFSIHFNDDPNAARRLAKVTSSMQGLCNNFERWIPKNDAPNPEPNALTANTFRAWEAAASRHYFRFLASVVPTQYKFENRNFRPALDKFNCLLNYLYGMLYAYVELALMKSGIDPSIGILHVDRYNRPTMVYDFIEAYRHWADTVALQLIFNDYLPQNAFSEVPEFMQDAEGDPEAQGFWLEKAGKPIVVNTFLQFMDMPIPYKHNQQKSFVDMPPQYPSRLDSPIVVIQQFAAPFDSIRRNGDATAALGLPMIFNSLIQLSMILVVCGTLVIILKLFLQQGTPEASNSPKIFKNIRLTLIKILLKGNRFFK